MRRHLILTVMLLFVLPGAISCTRGGDGGQTVDPQSVHPLDPDTLQVWLNEGRAAVLLDTRPHEAWEARHLPGATPVGTLSIPRIREVLPFDPEVPIVIYDEDGSASTGELDLATEAAVKFGFPRVYRLTGGMEAWIARGHDLDGNALLSP